MKCSSCGADTPNHAIACDYCGSHLPIETDSSPGNGANDRAGIFREIKQSPAFMKSLLDSRLKALPTFGIFPMAMTLAVVFSCVFTAVTGAMGVSAFIDGASFIFALVPLGMALFGIFMVVATIKTVIRFTKTTPVGTPCIITGKRTSVSGGGRNSPASTSHYITVELESGRRREFPIPSRLFANLAEEDAGILYTRATVALDFDRIIV